MVLIILINLAVFAAVFLLVCALFRAPIQSVDESVFRIEVDNVNRNGIFESPTIRPLLLPLYQIVLRLNMPGFKKHVLKLLLALGNPNQYSADEYVVVCLMWGIIGAIGFWLSAWGVTGYVSVVGAVLFIVTGFFGGFFMAYLWLRERAIKRLRIISKQLPYSLDLIAMAMDAGATFYEAATTVVRDAPNEPLNQEFGILIREVDFGRSRQDALIHLGQRITVDGLDGILSAVLQAEQLGTPLAEVLKLQANLLRMRRSMRAERKAGEAAVKMLIPSMLILMCVVLIIFAPFIVKFLNGTYLD